MKKNYFCRSASSKKIEIKEVKCITEVEISDYRGKVVSSWIMPKNEKHLIWSIIKPAQFYYRCKKSSLLTSEVISVLKDFVNLEAIKQHFAVAIVSYPEVLTAIQEIKSLKNHGFNEGFVRMKGYGNVCSLCGSHLKHPVHIVFRNRVKIIKNLLSYRN